MRRFFTLVCLLCLAIPAGITISGCSRDPQANYCNGLGYGQKITDVASIDLEPRTTGISLAWGQTKQISTPKAATCKGDAASVTGGYSYGTTNNLVVDISVGARICAGRWNRNSGGGIADYTICSAPNPLPDTNGLPYATAYITASASSVTSNPVQVYVHPQVTSVALALSGSQQCYSQGQLAQLDAQACFAGANNQQQVLCAPSSVVSSGNYACAGGLPAGLTTVPNCTSAIGPMTFSVATPGVASINNETNQITAAQPGTTLITASVAGSGSSAGYFTTCAPQSISLTLSNGKTVGTITRGVTQNLVTSVIDTQGNKITGLNLDYQSTDPVDISVGAGGAVATAYPGEVSIFAVCQPTSCNPSPISQVGLYGTGLSVSSNAVNITVPGTASDFLWLSAPGKSQYFIPVELISGTVGSTVRLPYVPNSMVMDKTGTYLHFGSSTELMTYSTISNTLYKQDTSVPGVVLAVAPNDSLLLINDQSRKLFYVYTPSTGGYFTFGGLGNAATWTPDSKTLYITDNAALNDPPLITGHKDMLYVYTAATGWTTYPLPPSPLPPSAVAPSGLAPNIAVQNVVQTPALTIPGVGAYLRGTPTVAHTWCPAGTVGNYASMSFYPIGDEVYSDPGSTLPVQTDALAATTDGQHILGAAMIGGSITLSDIGVTIPTDECLVTTSGAPPNQTQTVSALSISHTLSQTTVDPNPALGNVNATSVNQVIPSPASNFAFVTYEADSNNTNALLPYYIPGAGGSAGTVNYLSLTGASGISAPVAGAFSPDDKLFFVSTAGDNKVHYISIPLLSTDPAHADTEQIAPSLPACAPISAGGKDLGCTLPASGPSVVPATVIAVKPRTTT